jgi:uncharacterized repeat protein (TIGR01451 family)
MEVLKYKKISIGKKSLSTLKSQSEFLPIVFIVAILLSSSFILGYQNLTGYFVSSDNITETLAPENITYTTIVETTNTNIIQDTTTTLSQNSVLDVSIEHPEKITRGETVEIKAVVKNNGPSDVKNVIIVWQLPLGFNIISGEKEKNCGDLEKSSSCLSEISVKVYPYAELGNNEIKVVVRYE